MYLDEKKNDVLSSREAALVDKRRRDSQKSANWELIELTRLAEKEGYGASYGKFVQQTGR